MHSILEMRRQLQALALAGACGLFGGCASPPSQTKSGAEVKATKTPAVTESARVNIDEIFPAGPGRELLLNNCTSCHTFVPIVVLQMDKNAWERNSRIHRSRVPALSNDDFDVLYQYLVANFNPDRPVPTLPKELLETWTSY